MMAEQKADKFSNYAMVFVVGWIACSAYYKIPNLWQKQAALVQVQTQVVPKLKSIAGCQTVRARVATAEAVRSENGADVNLAAIPNCPTLPKPTAKTVQK